MATKHADELSAEECSMSELLLTNASIIESGVLELDWTGYSGLMKCSRYGWHNLMLRRVLNYRDPALAFGSAIHAALDVRQRALMWGEAVEQATMEAALVPFFREPCSACLGRGEFNDGLCVACQGNGLGVLIELPDDEHRTLGRAKEVLGLYQQRWGNDEGFRVVESEQPCEQELGIVKWRFGGCNVRTKLLWQGIIDGIWEDNDGRLWVKDTKTMKYGSPIEQKAKYQMGGQLKMYCWLKGLTRAVVDVIVVRKPVARPRSDYPRNEFDRLPIEYEPNVIEDCRRDVLWNVGRWLESCSQLDSPPPMTGVATNACLWPKACQYLSVCEQVNEEQRMDWLMGSSYTENTWKPMKQKR
jgi:hypothetical protein